MRRLWKPYVEIILILGEWVVFVSNFVKCIYVSGKSLERWTVYNILKFNTAKSIHAWTTQPNRLGHALEFLLPDGVQNPSRDRAHRQSIHPETQYQFRHNTTNTASFCLKLGLVLEHRSQWRFKFELCSTISTTTQIPSIRPKYQKISHFKPWTAPMYRTIRQIQCISGNLNQSI